ncbi:hypothetical protein [uncultured Merdimonas sp.]|uniref:hypothetical protein n=1 Tax=uncultured Merdimonas sp. TaxID=2023269 RepID=UPI00320A18DD
MAMDLTTKYQPYVDEVFTTESKKSLLTNNDFSWTGAHTIKVYKVTTGQMNDYDRPGENMGKVVVDEDSETQTVMLSRYGAIESLDATTEEMTLKKDRSFTFAIDKLDADETQQQLSGASALARQQREVVIPEVDAYTYGVMATGAGTKPAAITLTETNIYTEIIKANTVLDDAEVPDDGNRSIVVTPAVLELMKKCDDITLNSDIGAELRLKGVVADLDGLHVIKIPKKRLPANFGFMVAHPCATVAPTKLEEYKLHSSPPFISGDLVEGRIVYDAFVLDNKKMAIYYQENKAATG